MMSDTNPIGLGDRVDVPAGSEVQLRLRSRLAADAGRGELLDVSYRTLESPFGPLLLAATELGLVRVAFAVEGHDDVLRSLAERISPRVLYAPARCDAAAEQLDEYFTGRRGDFELTLDTRLAHGFHHEVVDYLPRIRYGETARYGEIAAALDRPKAVRAVGTACARNPLPLILPCHRVIRSDGALGNYLGGIAVKRALLELEAASHPG